MEFSPLREYLNSLERGGCKKLADTIDVSHSYLDQMASGRVPISPARAVLLEITTQGGVLREEMVKDWQKIWPEFVPLDRISKKNRSSEGRK